MRVSLLALLLLVFGGAACTSENGTSSSESGSGRVASVASVDSPAPTFALPAVSGGTLSFPGDLTPRPSLLYFSMGPG